MQQGRNNGHDSQINNGKKSILATAIRWVTAIVISVVIPVLLAYDVFPCQREIIAGKAWKECLFPQPERHENPIPSDQQEKPKIVPKPSNEVVKSDASQEPVPPPPPPPPPSPSRLDTLLAALDQWRSLGVKADPASLSLLQTVKNEDQVIFSKTSDSAWAEIQAPKDILRAPEIRLTAETLSRLPVFVKSVQQTERDLKLTHKVIERFVDAGFRMSANEQHAAVIIVLGAHKFVDIPNYPSGPSGVQEFWAERVTLAAYAIYNINNEELFPEFSVTGYAEGSTEISRDKLAGCALLDAGLNATDKLIEMIGAKSRPFREKC